MCVCVLVHVPLRSRNADILLQIASCWLWCLPSQTPVLSMSQHAASRLYPRLTCVHLYLCVCLCLHWGCASMLWLLLFFPGADHFIHLSTVINPVKTEVPSRNNDFPVPFISSSGVYSVFGSRLLHVHGHSIVGVCAQCPQCERNTWVVIALVDFLKSFNSMRKSVQDVFGSHYIMMSPLSHSLSVFSATQ